MPTAIRELVLAGLAARLETLIAGNPGLKVYRNRRSVTEAPALIIRDGAQRTDANNFGLKRHVMTPVIAGFLTADSDDEIGPALNELYRQVIDALEADRTLGATPGTGPAVDVRESGLDLDLEEEAADGEADLKHAAGAFYLTVEIEFTTRQHAAGEVGP